MKIFIKFVYSFALMTCLSADAQSYYNVLKYGARNDSSALCTKAIEAAIEAAFKTGGGTVYFPSGKYLTGPIRLRSNITIFIDAGAVLHFSDDFDHYLPMVPSRWEGTTVNNFSPLFYAYKAENIAIRGRGIIDGHGKKWWDMHFSLYKKDQQRNKWQEEFSRNNQHVTKPDIPEMIDRGFLRPPFIQPMYCKNILIEGITIRNSPFWTVNPEFCENVTVTGITINNPHSPNTDGINPESCKNVHISNCHISVGDDCITIKSGKDEDGRKINMAAENYTITNCTMLSGHGGVVIGSEMSGGVRKIVISNCVFDGTERGIRIKTARGRGGIVEDIRVDNIIMKNILDQAIVLDMQYAKTQPAPVSEKTPQFRNIHFSNITAETKQAIFINGLAEMPVSDISFSDIQFESKTGALIREAKDISFDNVRINTAHGAALHAQNVTGLTLRAFHSANPQPGQGMLVLDNVQQVFITASSPILGTDLFLDLRGESKDIVLKGNNFKHTRRPVAKTAEIAEEITID